MILESAPTATRLELTVHGYQSPDECEDAWETNWLLVTLRVQGPTAYWDETEPLLTAWEAHGIAHWLEDLGTRSDTLGELFFTEPAFWLEHAGQVDDLVHVRAKFDAEWMEDPPEGATELVTDLLLTRDALRAAAEHLRLELTNYPVRGEARLF